MRTRSASKTVPKRQKTDNDWKILSILDEKEELPQELRGVIDDYERKRRTSLNDKSEFLDALEDRLLYLLVKDIYKDDHQWNPNEVETAMEFFPTVLPPSPVKTITEQYIEDYQKKLSILEKKEQFPKKLQEEIENFRGNHATTTSNTARDFLDHMEKRVNEFVCNDTKNGGCQWEPCEVETAVRLFPGALKYENYKVFHSIVSTDGFHRKRALLLPLFLDLAIQSGGFTEQELDECIQRNDLPQNSNSVLEKICLSTDESPQCAAVIDKVYISLLEDLKKRGILNMVNVDIPLMIETMLDKCDLDNKCFRYRFWYMVNLVPGWESFTRLVSDDVFYKIIRTTIPSTYEMTIRPNVFFYIFGAELWHFPSRMGYLFERKYDYEYSYSYESECEEYGQEVIDQIIFDVLEHHSTVATAQARIDLLVYAANTKSVPVKFRYFLVRREPLFLERSSA